MDDTTTTVRASIDVGLEPAAAFAVFGEELAAALAVMGIRFEAGPRGHVTAADWQTDEVTRVELRFEPANGGTRVTAEHHGWGRVIGDAGELTGWFAGQVVAPLLRATTPAAFGDWLTDRGARRPSGARARGVYRDPLYH